MKHHAKIIARTQLAKLIRNKIPESDTPRRLRMAATRNTLPQPEKFAHAAGLRYVSDVSPGIHREGKAPRFRFRSPTGRLIRDDETLKRIRSLVIPPAWREVWICPDPHGHIQVTGLDARGRKQYRYHPRWRTTRDETKFHRMIAFARALPALRRRVTADLRRKGLPREKVLAAIVLLLEKSLIRVGNAQYAKDNHSYGLTTIRDDHVKIRGAHVHFEFRGKSGVEHAIDLNDARLARLVKRCQELPGQELFAYVDSSGRSVDVTSNEVNAYLKEITGDEFTAKDFRTWPGTVLAARALREVASFDTQAAAKKNIVAAIERVAKRLGNTRSVCRKCYVHPAVVDAYLDGSLVAALSKRASEELKKLRHLEPEEAAILAFLQERLRRESHRRAA